MPNTGHVWTEDEEQSALELEWDEFSAQHPDISKDAYRIRRQTLRRSNSLHEELVALTVTGCKVCSFLRTVRPEHAAQWQEEMGHPIQVISHIAVVEALRSRGLSVSETSVRRHRRNHLTGGPQ